MPRSCGFCGSGNLVSLNERETRLTSGVESGEAVWQQGGAASVGEEAEVADTDETLGEQGK